MNYILNYLAVNVNQDNHIHTIALRLLPILYRVYFIMNNNLSIHKYFIKAVHLYTYIVKIICNMAALLRTFAQPRPIL